MLSQLHIRLRATIEHHQMIGSGDVVGVGVSGGADSVALLLLLQELSQQLGIRMVVLHFNHMLRGGESDGDELFVADLAKQCGLEFIAGRGDVSARAAETGDNLEDTARRCRYGFFAGLVKDGRISRVAVAHTADDQAETVLAKMIRGTGPAGLGGIHPVVGHVARPAIDVRRMELREFLNARGQAWREDSTNLDESKLRARIRSRLLPLLEQEFQTAIVSQLSHLSTLSRADEEFWSALVNERFQALVQRGGDRLSVRVRDLLAPMDMGAPNPAGPGRMSALSTRLTRRILLELKGDLLGFTSRHVQDVLHLATASTSGHEIHLPGGIVVERNFDELSFARTLSLHEGQKSPSKPLPEAGFEHVLALESVNGEAVDIPEIGLRLHLKVIDWPAGERETKHEATVADWACLRAPLVVRNWRPGDTIRPQGRQRTRKLKHLLRERRIALRHRRNWPVITSAGELVWTRGFPPARNFSAGRNTRKALVISEEPL